MAEDEACNEEAVLESLAPHSKLQSLKVHGYGGLEISQWMRDPQMFGCVRKLIISDCPRCKDLPVVWLSVSLEYLSLYNMGSLTTLCKSIEADAEGYNNTPPQVFRKLKEMVLDGLPNLERWAENNAGEPSCGLLVFPQLEKLYMISCPKLASVPGSPVLNYLRIRNCCSLPISSLAHLTTLSELYYDVEGIASMSMPLGSWSSLVKLQVSSAANMMMMPPEDQQNQSQRALENLRELSLDWVPTAPSLSKSHLGLWEFFAFVEDLRISDCDELVRWPVEELRCLVRLRSLTISFCSNLEGIPMLPASLELLEIQGCRSLVALPSNLGNLAKLRVLKLYDCGGLKALPDGMDDDLASLEQLTVISCPGIEKFPHGLLQRIPALTYLEIYGCPDLQRRCRQGGEYFHLVSSIPERIISIPERIIPAAEPNAKRFFLKRLLPSC